MPFYFVKNMLFSLMPWQSNLLLGLKSKAPVDLKKNNNLFCSDSIAYVDHG